MMLRAMPAVALLLVEHPMPNWSKVMTQTKKGYPDPPGWGLRHETNKLTSIRNLIVEKHNNGCQMDNTGKTTREKLQGL
jgi:hypothetical protein